MVYSKGISWLDDTRIPFVDDEGVNFDALQRQSDKGGDVIFGGGCFSKEVINKIHKPEGRFTPNLLCCDDVLNDGSRGGNNTSKFYEAKYTDTSNIYGKYKQLQVTQYKDKGSNSRYYDIDLWFNQLLNNL